MNKRSNRKLMLSRITVRALSQIAGAPGGTGLCTVTACQVPLTMTCFTCAVTCTVFCTVNCPTAGVCAG